MVAKNGLLVVRPTEGRVWNVGGPMVCKVSSEDTQGAYTVLELTLPPGSGAPLHIHRREDEVFYVLEGMCTVGDAYQEQTVLAGATAVFRKGVAHFFRNSGDATCRVLITAIPGGLDHYFNELDTALNANREHNRTVDAIAAINRKYEIEFFTDTPRDAE
jgi:quercetin dioxygenase-like cupin family protein